MFDYFFWNVNDIPPGHTWKMYGIEHITWLVIIGVVMFYFCKLFRKSDLKKQNKILKGFAILIVVQEILKDILHWYAGSITLEHLPFHLCGVSIFFVVGYAIKSNKLNEQYLYALCLPGALLALLFPNWTEYPIMHFSCMNSFTIHAELVIFVMMLLTSRRLHPCFKDLKYTGIFILIYSIPIYFINKVWDTNFMFINTPSEGSPLVIIYNIFGRFYIPAFYALAFVGWILMYLPWEIRKRKHHESICIN